MSESEPEPEPEEKVEQEKKPVKGGELLFCGGTRWNAYNSSRKTSTAGNLVSPTRLQPIVGVDIRLVVSGCVSCHCMALDVEGRCYTWGRNDKGQLGHGDITLRDGPTLVSGLLESSGHNIIGAGAGRSHTVVVTKDGLSLSFGWNKHGQLGSGSLRNEIESSPIRCLVSDAKSAACGADFSVWLTSVGGASIQTAGLPQYGQLGHGTDNEYNTRNSSVRLAYEPQPCPKAVASLAGETIVKVACGTNHTVAVDSNGFVYTWGSGDYGRLGHKKQKDEWVPHRVEIFTKHNVLPPNALISAGSVSSACTADEKQWSICPAFIQLLSSWLLCPKTEILKLLAFLKGGGQMYMWGKVKNKGDEWMYPKPLFDLSGWNIRCMDSGNMRHFVGAESSCISWGNALSGELGYGPDEQKTSSLPKKVDILEGMHVISVASGLFHSMVVVDRQNVGDRLDQLDVYDAKALSTGTEEPETRSPVAKRTTEKYAAKTSENSKRKKL